MQSQSFYWNDPTKWKGCLHPVSGSGYVHFMVCYRATNLHLEPPKFQVPSVNLCKKTKTTTENLLRGYSMFASKCRSVTICEQTHKIHTYIYIHTHVHTDIQTYRQYIP